MIEVSKLPLPYRAKITQNHAVFVVGMLGQAAFHGMMSMNELHAHYEGLRVKFVGADASEEALLELQFEVARMEEIIAELLMKQKPKAPGR